MHVIRPDIEAFRLPNDEKEKLPDYMVFFWREVEEQEFDWKYLIQDYVVVEGAEDACEVISWAKDQAKGRIIAVYLMAYPKVSREPSVAQLSRVYGNYPEGEKHREDDFFEFTV